MAQEPYELFYWPSIQGRGEFVRLCLEDAGAPYVDVARSEALGGVGALRKLLEGDAGGALRPFAPPILRHGSLLLAQVANILDYLGPRLGLVLEDEAARRRALQLQLTITDFVSEIHDTHHPISAALFYEQQRDAAAACAGAFLEHRLPKFLRYFESVVAAQRDSAVPLSTTGRHGYVDLSLFQVVSGLRYAFPRAMRAIEPELPGLVGVHARVEARPRVAAYLASPRRLPWSPNGLFRAYPELDLLPAWAVGNA